MPRLSENERIDEVNEKISLIQKKDGLTFGTDAFLLASFIRPQKSALAVELDLLQANLLIHHRQRKPLYRLGKELVQTLSRVVFANLQYPHNLSKLSFKF